MPVEITLGRKQIERICPYVRCSEKRMNKGSSSSAFEDGRIYWLSGQVSRQTTSEHKVVLRLGRHNAYASLDPDRSCQSAFQKD